MDYEYITSQEGYRYEDLKEEDQRVMNFIDGMLAALDDYCPIVEPETLLEKIQAEIIQTVVEDLKVHLESKALEIQIYLAESEED